MDKPHELKVAEKATGNLPATTWEDLYGSNYPWLTQVLHMAIINFLLNKMFLWNS